MLIVWATHILNNQKKNIVLTITGVFRHFGMCAMQEHRLELCTC